jgi:hypothetical protein
LPVAVERTLVLIKPDAMQRQLAGEILARFERRGLALREARLLRVDRNLAETHYAEHAEKPFYGELVEFITSGSGSQDDGGDGSGGGVRRVDPRTVRPVDAGQPRARLGLAGVGRARAAALVR